MCMNVGTYKSMIIEEQARTEQAKTGIVIQDFKQHMVCRWITVRREFFAAGDVRRIPADGAAGQQ